MSNALFEDAIEKISKDEDYSAEISFDPNRILKDFQISADDFGGFTRHGDFNHKIKEVRPIALCCTCVAPS